MARYSDSLDSCQVLRQSFSQYRQFYELLGNVNGLVNQLALNVTILMSLQNDMNKNLSLLAKPLTVFA